jgi:hypothetical protein
LPILGLVILLVQIGCAVHVVRTGRPYWWIYLIVFVPIVGMAAYIIAELLPDFMQSQTARQARSGMERAINPGKALRAAMRAAEITPTVENKAALAEQYLLAARPTEAAALYRESLTGIHATDPGIMLGLAQALFAQGDAAQTQRVLEELRQANPGYHSPEGHLLYARSLEQQGKMDEALDEFRALAAYYPGQEARCRYAMMLQSQGRGAEARKIFEEICQLIDYGPRHQRRAQRHWYETAKRALAAS